MAFASQLIAAVAGRCEIDCEIGRGGTLCVEHSCVGRSRGCDAFVYGSQKCFPLPDVERINNPVIAKGG